MGSKLIIPVLKTPEDVLAHKGKPVAPAAKKPAPALAPAPAAKPAPAPTPPPPKPSVEEVAAGLVSQYKKDDLVKMCEDAGLEAEGTKAELAHALAEAQAED